MEEWIALCFLASAAKRASTMANVWQRVASPTKSLDVVESDVG